MRVVLDTSAMVAAIRSNAGASRRLLAAALERQITLIASVPLMIEYEAVMTRAEHLQASALSRTDIGMLLDAVAAVAEPTPLRFRWRPVARDPADDMIVETAVNGSADVIATFNARDFPNVTKLFGVEGLSPGDTWKRWRAVP